ncbi:hypothetical protein C9374_000569 [Naegleria lovaniensis]|uniref:F-box domain-containing protein n=1 Tax=Naegleria lovaniensis TaxID=51637 RepID=A0AA88KLZ1_NAELO|nr:uncharacterized protein C9374_000569 [Naegleria lovaniensis]KAG2388405.1 hypothetical protein C9374_000569 [Naegleria lovaniensis]
MSNYCCFFSIDVIFHVFEYCSLKDILSLSLTWKVCNEALHVYSESVFNKYYQVFSQFVKEIDLHHPQDTSLQHHSSTKEKFIALFPKACKEMNEETEYYPFHQGMVPGGFHNCTDLFSRMIALDFKALHGANDSRTIFDCRFGLDMEYQRCFKCSDRLVVMPEILSLMGWNWISQDYDLKLLRFYVLRIIAPYYPNNVPGIVLKQPESMKSSNISSLWFKAQSEFTEPEFHFVNANNSCSMIGKEEKRMIRACFWILHDRTDSSEILLCSHRGKMYSKVELLVDYESASIENIRVLCTVKCPSKENFKTRNGTCLVH